MLKSPSCGEVPVRIQFLRDQADLPIQGERTVMQESLFYGFSLEYLVPTDHLLRSIDRFVDLSDLREHLRHYYREIGGHFRSGR